MISVSFRCTICRLAYAGCTQLTVLSVPSPASDVTSINLVRSSSIYPFGGKGAMMSSPSSLFPNKWSLCWTMNAVDHGACVVMAVLIHRRSPVLASSPRSSP